MATTGSFTAVGSGTAVPAAFPGELVWAITGTFVATIALEHDSGSNGVTWARVISLHGVKVPASGSFTMRPGSSYRFRCVSFTSGTVAYSLTPSTVASTLPTTPPQAGSGVWWSNSGVLGVA